MKCVCMVYVSTKKTQIMNRNTKRAHELLVKHLEERKTSYSSNLIEFRKEFEGYLLRCKGIYSIDDISDDAILEIFGRRPALKELVDEIRKLNYIDESIALVINDKRSC